MNDFRIRDDFIISCMERTGYPPWMQATFEEVEKPKEEEEELSELCMDVLNRLRFGKEYAIDRKALCAETGAGDRSIREAIETLRQDYIILNDQDGKGYYRPDKADDVRRYYRQEMARVYSMLRRMKPVRRYLKMEGML